MTEFLSLYSEYFLRLLVAMLLGFLCGIERQITGKSAGLKTHGLVSMGSALYVVISIIIAAEFEGETVFDPLRMASHIIVGVGFIGGGAIFLRGASVSGLTTAANLWVAAGIGMASGFGLYSLAIFVTLLSVLTFLAFRGFRSINNYFKKDKK